MINLSPTFAGAALLGAIATSLALALLVVLLPFASDAPGNGLIRAVPGLLAICAVLALPLWLMFRRLGLKQCQLGPSLHLVSAFSLYVSLVPAAFVLVVGLYSAPLSSFFLVVASAAAVILYVGGPLFFGGWLQLLLLKRHNISFNPDALKRVH